MFRRIAVVSSVLLTLGAGAALAQGGPPAGGPPPQGQGNFAQRRMQMMLQGITLAPAQQTRVDSIVAAFNAQMPAFTPGQPMDSTTRARGRELRMRQDSTIRALLTPEQQRTWDTNAANMPQRPGRGPGGN